MQSKRYIDKNFYIVRFKMNKGDEKIINKSEVIRNGKDRSTDIALRLGIEGIPDNQIVTPRSITVIVSGKIAYRRKGVEDRVKLPGDGAWRWTWNQKEETESSFVAYEDNSEYHCIIPRDINAEWLGKIHVVDSTSKITVEETDKFRQALYVCKGKIFVQEKGKSEKVEVPAPTIVDVSPNKILEITASDDSMFVELWIDGD